MTSARESTAAYWINNEKKQNPGLAFDEQYDTFMRELAEIVKDNNPGVSDPEAIIRATLIMMTRGDAGLSRYKIDSITVRLMHSLKDYLK